MSTTDTNETSYAPDRPTTLASSVYEKLRDDILSARLLPDEKLSMDGLRLRYSIGASPLREALNRLASERLVTQADQKGFRVASVSIKDLHELTHTRCLINEIALRESMRNADPDWEDNLVLAHRRMVRAHAGEALTEEAKLRHLFFHRALIVGCGSKLIIDLAQDLFEEAARYRLLAIATAASRRDAETEHKDILDAVLARDIERAVQLSNDHIRRTASIVLQMNVLPSPRTRAQRNKKN